MIAWSLTWLWQGAALTLVVLLALRALPHLNAATRYAIWWCALGALGALGAAGVPGAAGALGAAGAKADLPWFVVPSLPRAFLAVALGAWAAIALVKLARLLVGIHGLNALRDRCRAFPADVEAQLPLWLEVRARGRKARLMVSDGVPGAAVLGFFCPVIVLPYWLLSSLTRDELDQVILHEHAHVQRWDDWTRLAQQSLEAAFWIHPAAVLTARQLDLEREIACDEWVVARTQQPKDYARCLTRAAEVRGWYIASTFGAKAHSSLGPALFQRKRDLFRRMERLLAVKGCRRQKTSTVAALTGALALMLLTMQLHALPLVGEIEEIVLPAFAHARYGAAGSALAPVPPHAAASSASAPVAVTARKPVARVAHSESVAPVAPPVAPVAPVRALEALPDIPLTLEARSIAAQYSPVSAIPANDDPSPWRKASSAGVRFADTFARAGVSIARRF